MTITPYTDNVAQYDTYNHRYILDENYIMDSMNINLDEILEDSSSADRANTARILLDRISMQIYEYIYSTTPYRFEKEKELATESRYRFPIIKAMQEQLIYIINNGDVSAYNGIDLENNTAIDVHRLRDADVSELAKSILTSAGCVCRAFKFGFEDLDPNYERDGY